MPTGKALVEQMARVSVGPGSLALWGLGQMGLAVKGPDGLLMIDPCLSNVVEELFGSWWFRGYPPPLEPAELAGANYLLISHEHLDHLDPQTAGPAARANPEMRLVAPGWCIEPLAKIGIGAERVMVPPALEAMPLPGTSARVTAVPSAHYAKEYDEQKGYRWLGYLIEWNGVTLYHAGDTIIYKGYLETLKGLPQIDVAMLPVNGRDWYREDTIGAVGNLLPDEAAWLGREAGLGSIIVGHNDLFPNNAIPFGSIADAFARGTPRLPYRILQPGELWMVVK
jgi:L-ascorbate metabolism protein UlaG (beta-lactamase superfamily)